MGGRLGDVRWDLEPAAADPPLRVLAIKMHQQFESPAAVVATVRRRWQPTFDAMASPFSAVCGAYATLEDDILAPGVVPARSVVYVNPAYAPRDLSHGAAGMDRDVWRGYRTVGCTVLVLCGVGPYSWVPAWPRETRIVNRSATPGPSESARRL